MKSMKKTNYLSLLALVILCGCGSSGSKKTEPAVGADRDSHGCIGSAGYQWSEVRQTCIRPFETGIKMRPMTPQQTTGATLAAFIVFSTDSAQAELFLPDTTEILERRHLPQGGSAWNVEDDDTKNVRQIDGRWVIEQRNQVLYTQDPYPIHVVFDGSDGKTKKRYQVEVTFEPEQASVNLDGTIITLPQYVTADGYGYKNDMADLRGKADTAILILRDGLTLHLTEQE